MGTVTAERLLRAWESTLAEQTVRRAAALLAVCRDEDTTEVARWGVAERDAALFDLRGELFGTQATALAECPDCGGQLEVPLDLRALRPRPSGAPTDAVSIDGYRVRAHPPSTEDLLAASVGADEEAALEALLARCVEQVLTPAGEELALAAVPARVGHRIRAHLSSSLEDVDLDLALTCVRCGSTFHAPFDIATFLLREVEVWAHRLLAEVHVLAGAYGWAEGAILGLSARRRRSYLDLIEGVT